MDIPPVALFAAASCGVKTANVLVEINTEVVSTTIGSYGSVKAKSIAQSLLGQERMSFSTGGNQWCGVIEAVKSIRKGVRHWRGHHQTMAPELFSPVC